MTNTLIEAKTVTVIRQGRAVLEDVSLTVKAGGFTTIIGPNGAGKSMLLKCLLGFYRPDNGTVMRRKGLRIGYVPQHFVPEHTMPITTERFLRLCKKTETCRLEEVYAETGIKHILERPLARLAGGELQRVLLARSLLDQTELLVLDEPAQNLDIAGQLAFYKLLKRIYAQRNLSILMVSHDLHMVMASTKHVVCLFHHVCCCGEPHAVTKDPEFITLFGHDVADMMAVYHHSHDHSHDVGHYR